ncbi:hypothetical protein MHYP_G00032680 [Metynnis hypsauchen]
MPASPTPTRHETVSRTTLTFTGVIRLCRRKARRHLHVTGTRESTRACAPSAGWRSGMGRSRMEASLEKSEGAAAPFILQLLTFCRSS